MRIAPTSSLPRRLGLFLAERTRVLDAAGATVGGALLAAYGAALAGGAPTPGPLLGAVLAAGLFTGLAFLQTAVLGPDQGASGALARGLVRPAEARGLGVLFAAGQLAALAAIDPPLAAFAPGLWAALQFTTPRRAARGLCVAAVAALGALATGGLATGAPPPAGGALIGIALGVGAALAAAGLAVAAADWRRLAARGPALAAGSAVAVPVLLAAAVAREAGPGLVAGLAALAALASIAAAAAALGHASPRRVARVVHAFAAIAVAVLAIG